MSKLYKLVKITRLIRLFKLMKQKKKLEKKVKNVMYEGAQYERLSFFILVLLLLCHFVGCLWIFIAKSFSDEEVENDSWIEASDFEDQNMMDLYASSIYFVMQTITTVGYGDITIVTPTERIICILLQLIGVISFSFASGALTSIIANIDQDENKN